MGLGWYMDCPVGYDLFPNLDSCHLHRIYMQSYMTGLLVGL